MFVVWFRWFSLVLLVMFSGGFPGLFKVSFDCWCSKTPCSEAYSNAGILV